MTGRVTGNRVPEPMRDGCFACGLVFLTEQEAVVALKKGHSIIRCQCDVCKAKRERINV